MDSQFAEILARDRCYFKASWVLAAWIAVCSGFPNVASCQEPKAVPILDGGRLEIRPEGKYVQIQLPDDDSCGAFTVVAKNRGIPFTTTQAARQTLILDFGSGRLKGRIEIPDKWDLSVDVEGGPLGTSEIMRRLRLFGFDRITELTVLEPLSLDLLQEISRHRRLRYLNAFSSKELDSESGRSLLSGMRRLEYLAVGGQYRNCSNAFALSLADMQSLRGLRLNADGVGDEFVAVLATMKNLETIELVGRKTKISGSGLLRLSELPNLQEIVVYCNATVEDGQLASFCARTSASDICISSNSPALSKNIARDIALHFPNQTLALRKFREPKDGEPDEVDEAEQREGEERMASFPKAPQTSVFFCPVDDDRELALTTADSRRVTRPDGEVDLRPLVGDVHWPSSKRIFIALREDSGAELADKLKLLRAFSNEDISEMWALGPLDSHVAAEIAINKELRQLKCRSSSEIDGSSVLKSIRSLTKLEVLNIRSMEGSEIREISFAKAVGSLGNLRYLSIPCREIGDDFVAAFKDHPKLECVELRTKSSRLTGKSLRAISSMPKIRHVYVHCSEQIEDADVMSFSSLKNLELLTIYTDASLNSQDDLRKVLPAAEINIVKAIDDTEIR